MSVTDGSGFETLHPNAGTRNYIIKNDMDFALEVDAHNQTCKKQPGCKKP